ncbi:MaoC family dehydratase [Shimia abyssi]|nr:MaoC family dehydratase [Shimia abyssi]
MRDLLMRLVGTDAGPDMPLIAPAMLLGDGQIVKATEGMTAQPGETLVHEFQQFNRFDLPENSTEIEIEITEKYAGSSIGFDFAIGKDAGFSSVMQTRLRLAARSELQGLKGAEFHEKLAAEGAQWVSLGAIQMSDVRAYLDLTHDKNPIHVDDTAARAAGLSGTILPGMLLCGLAEYALGHAQAEARIEQMKTRFMAPVPVGEAVDFVVVPRKWNAQGALTVVRQFVLTTERVIAAVMDVQLRPSGEVGQMNVNQAHAITTYVN